LIPIEVVEGIFFFLLALVLAGPGQELGRALDRVPNRVLAYSVNILGSLTGIALFAACSRLELSPFWWFFLIALGLGYFLFFSRCVPRSRMPWSRIGYLAGVLVLASLSSGSHKENGRRVGEHLWSPYYRIDYDFPHRSIEVNLISHQTMVSRDAGFPAALAYPLPYLFERDTRGEPFADVLVIGAGSGNDVSRALQWGARHVDAVEIDPVILRLGKRDHPDRPYQDPRVTTYSDDGRNFLRSSDRQYDLIVYALVDSLVLHSSYSNLRLESFLFTREALADVRRHLRPGGLFVMYNFFRQGWIVGRLHEELRGTFGTEPLVLTLPYTEVVTPDAFGGFTMFASGATGGWREAFARHPEY
jgi:SAM-dependent methyltransferase